MFFRLLKSDLKNHKVQNAAALFLIMAATAFLSLGAFLFTSLLGSVDALMQQAKVPDLIQMHMGDVDLAEIESFVLEHPDIDQWQVNEFLNIDSAKIVIRDKAIADSTQDNGVSVQSEKMDYLLGMDGNKPDVLPGEIYLPIAYKSLYNLEEDDTIFLAGFPFRVAGYIRDGQMNSMMSSSKRFLVSEPDYQMLLDYGQPEKLIEFSVVEGADVGALENAYTQADLPHNGVMVSTSLIKMINALSDGTTIFVIFLVAIIVLIVAMICIRFILGIQLEQSKKEIGLLKALGLSGKQIQRLYESKYLLFLAAGSLLGISLASALVPGLSASLHELYGSSASGQNDFWIALLLVVVTDFFIYCLIHRTLKRMDKMHALDALFQKQKKSKPRVQNLLIAAIVCCSCFVMAVPANLLNTITSSSFVTNMGIGNAQFRIDLSQQEDMNADIHEIEQLLLNDPDVEKSAVLKTYSIPVTLPDGESSSMLVEAGDQYVFPLTYDQGRAPQTSDEIALSYLQAEAMHVQTGDWMTITLDGAEKQLQISGLYSDITNGGKTAKVLEITGAGSPVWAIAYFSLTPQTDADQWLSENSTEHFRILDMKEYVSQIYSQLSGQLTLASRLIDGLALFVLFMVLCLFMHLMIEQNRYSISLEKALGFSDKDLKIQWFKKGFIPVVAGLVSGLLAGWTLGESICAAAMRSFGARGFHFETNWIQMFCIIPLLVLVVSLFSIWISIRQITHISPLESCQRKE